MVFLIFQVRSTIFGLTLEHHQNCLFLLYHNQIKNQTEINSLDDKAKTIQVRSAAEP
jgi:hypothetical protein